MSDLIDREAVRLAKVPYDELLSEYERGWNDACEAITENAPAASPWRRVEEPPKEAGEYIVAYHPCWWDDVKTQVTKVGIDSFRGKASWAKRKTQRVTHWMEKPEPPKEDA